MKQLARAFAGVLMLAYACTLAQAQRPNTRDTVITGFGSLPSLTTAGDSFVDVGVIDCQLYSQKQLGFIATTNNLSVQVLGSLDKTTYPFTEIGAFTVSVGTPVVKGVSDYWASLKVQVKTASAGLNGTLATQWAATSSGGGGGGSATIGSVTQGTTPWTDNISQVGGSSLVEGQTTMSASVPVAPASDWIGKQRVTQWFAGFTTDYDSTVTSLPNTITVLTALTIVAQGAYINNTDSVSHTVTITDTAGHEYVSAFVIPANSNLFLNWGPKGLKLVGIKWNADAASKVNGQIVGLQ